VAEPIIKLRDLTKQYGDFTAVDRLNLDIHPGEIFGLLGPNGAGKSTTILMMLGLTEPTSGTSTVCGLDSTRYPMEVKRKVGYLPDDVGFYDDRDGLDNLMYTAMLNGMSEREAEERAWHLLERVGLKEAAHKRTGAYSRGMRQRLGLADVLIKRPEVIILDEPTLGIDPEGVRELLDLIRRLSREDGITVLISSHHLHQMQAICDRVGLFVKGRLLAEGDIRTLAQQLFVDSYTSIELGIEVPGGTLEQAEAIAGRLAGLPDVVRVEKKEGLHVFHCSRDMAGELAKAVVEAGAVLTHLHRKDFGLDEIYHRYFEEGDPHAGASAATAKHA
jgi:ABC-2 type transport system ATP-binding protein